MPQTLQEALPAEVQEKVTAIEHAANLDYIDGPNMGINAEARGSMDQRASIMSTHNFRSMFCSDREVPKYAKSADADEECGESQTEGTSRLASEGFSPSGLAYGMRVHWDTLHVHSKPCVRSVTCDGRPNARLMSASEM